MPKKLWTPYMPTAGSAWVAAFSYHAYETLQFVSETDVSVSSCHGLA